MEIMEIEEEKEKSPWWSKVLTTILILCVVFCVFIGYGAGISNRFYKLLVVTSDSMTPVFTAGDLICLVRINPEQAKIGDIVTFQTEDGLLTHRIVDIKNDGEIVTKGDANESIDEWENGWKLGQVSAKYIFKIPKVGYFISWWQGLILGKHTGTGADFRVAVTSKNNQIIADMPTPTPLLTPLPEPTGLIGDPLILEPTETPIVDPQPTDTPAPTDTVEPPPILEPTETPIITPIPTDLEPTPTIEQTPLPTEIPEETPIVENTPIIEPTETSEQQ